MDRVFVLVGLGLTTACAPNTSTIAQADNAAVEVKAASFAADPQKLSTPDQALRAFIDFRNKIDEANCKWTRQSALPESAAERTQAKITNIRHSFFTGEAEKSEKHEISVSECVRYRDQIRLEISEVKIESPSRAIVLANLRNVGEAPEGRPIESFQKDNREKGENYKYEMTRVGSGWKISQIFRYQSYGDEGWKAVFDPENDRPQVPWIVTPS